MISGNDLIGQNARKGLCRGRLVNAFCLVLRITLYDIKKLINQSNDKSDKITCSRQTVMTLRYKQGSQINKDVKEKTVFSSSVPHRAVFHEYFAPLLAYGNRKEMLRETLEADEENP